MSFYLRGLPQFEAWLTVYLSAFEKNASLPQFSLCLSKVWYMGFWEPLHREVHKAFRE